MIFPIEASLRGPAFIWVLGIRGLQVKGENAFDLAQQAREARFRESEVMPREQRRLGFGLYFREEIGRNWWLMSVQEKEPNKAPEPTPTSVTAPANVGAIE